jgi:ZIP family zinc transporter
VGGIEMEHLLAVTLVGFTAGMLGTGIGGISAFVINKKGNRFMSFILEFSAGLMMAVVCFDLLPHAFELGGLEWTIIGIIIGVTLIIYLDNLIKAANLGKRLKVVNSRLLRVGILMMVGIALHNFPEGVAIGSGFEASVKLGLSLTFVIAIHNIPEGLAMAVPMRAGGMGNLKVLFYTIIAGVPMGIGAFVGAMLGEISQEVIAICLGFAGGAMLYIVCGDLIPESKSIYKGRLSTIGNILGIILGIIISAGAH